MELVHNSQKIEYRAPFGAVPTGSRVWLRLDIKGEAETVTLRLWQQNKEILVPMAKAVECRETAANDPNKEQAAAISQESVSPNQERTTTYIAEITVPEIPMLVWYYFIVQGKEGTFCCACQEDGLGGLGTTLPGREGKSFQITVFRKDFATPDWFKDRIMYQIFPDRFYGVHGKEGMHKKREEYILHEDWHAPISFNAHPYENGPACNDFYGGNLKGITAKLPYLKTLGVGVLYLNPIFDAYSNHKYDTANYKQIDPMFGTRQDFEELCQKAEECGIRIILDGVFSHTGADSVYFNKYGCYGVGVGAYQDPGSPYRSWYQFTDYPQYNSWWGCSNLPNVNEMEPTYLDYILRDEDAVVKKWLRHGAYGWRLDVADELPDEFIQILRREVKKQNPDAVIVGEVWEDASNKVAYGVQREYLMGGELDSVMNYPFKDHVLGFLMGWEDAGTLNRSMMALMEHYPYQVVYSLMNIIGTHDTMRVKSMLGGLNQDCGTTRLTSKMEELATRRVMAAAFIQMTYVGVPCIYYGDEVGMQGGRDPFNRGTFPWREIDPQLLSWYRELGKLRNSLGCLRRGHFCPVCAEGDVYAYVRCFRKGKDAFGEEGDGSFALCAVNRGREERQIYVDLREHGVTEHGPWQVLSGIGTEKQPVQCTFEGEDRVVCTIPPESTALVFNLL